MNATNYHNISEPPSWKAWILLFFLGLTWGSSYILIKKGLIAFSPTQVASLRISISALAFLPFFFLRYRKVKWQKWKWIGLVGFAGSFFPAFLFATAQTKLSSSLTGVLSTLTPLFTLLLGILFFRMPLLWSKIIGVLIGLVGAILLVFLTTTQGGEVGDILYGLLAIIATAGYGFTNNVIKIYLQDVSSLTISAISFFIVGIPASIFLFSTDFIHLLTNAEHGWASFGYICILALAGTVVASLLFFELIQRTNAVFASMVSYFIPIIALFWGVFDGEIIALFHIFGMALILTGVYISRK